MILAGCSHHGDCQNQGDARLGSRASIWPLVGHFCPSPDSRQSTNAGFRRYGPTFGLMHRSENAPSFDHLVCAGEEHRRNGEAKRLRGLEIDH